MQTPVVLIIYRRPDTTRKVFEEIRKAKPEHLFIIADGPKEAADEASCQATRAVVEDIDWPCEVRRNYADTNMGCGRRLPSGLDWVFEHVDRAIILEDDCLPSSSFFPFCSELLDRFKDDNRVMHINGNTYGSDFSDLNDYSYGFCNYAQVWGWATWRRAWKHYDADLTRWPDFQKSGLLGSLDGGKKVDKVRREKWGRVHRGEIDTWDYQWHFTVMSQSGLVVVPNRNLISNIGFDHLATHTTNADSHKANLNVEAVEDSLSHPPFIVSDRRINKVYRQNMLAPTLKKRVINKLRRVGKKVLPSTLW